ncbi:hypothetical protein TNCV_685201 [Trichonephila clavipes]|nr:hypothetical protein TNCV_685201 [Trichonephila clavipes]
MLKNSNEFVLKVLFYRAQCAPGRCLGAKSMCCCSADLAFSSHLFSKLSQNLNVVLFVYRLALRYPFSPDDVTNIEEKR